MLTTQKVSNILNAQTSNPDFEQYYKEHITKILLTRNSERYLCKGNYNITRIPYILKLFPDARFIIPVREPSAHIASLIKQHQLFTNGMAENSKEVEHLRRVGHYEFGHDMRLINTDNTHDINAISSLINSERNIQGWAKYWNSLYRFVLILIDDPILKDSIHIIRYEDLCADSENTLKKALTHCALDKQ